MQKKAYLLQAMNFLTKKVRQLYTKKNNKSYYQCYYWIRIDRTDEKRGHTSFFLSADKTECWYSVMAVSGGHMGLLQMDLNVISLTWPSYSSAACHCPIWKWHRIVNTNFQFIQLERKKFMGRLPLISTSEKRSSSYHPKYWRCLKRVTVN